MSKKRMTQRDLMSKNPECKLVCTGEELFVVFNGIKIAKREARKWISLEPGYVVHDNADYSGISVEFNGAQVH
jgi:hypothetical protein